MAIYIPNAELERKTILRKYRELLSLVWDKTTPAQRETIHKAMALAAKAHKDMRRKSGEPYIYHPLAVAKIVVQDINLGTTSVVCALLHDVVEDTEYTLEDIRDMFGDKVARITDGLTKIENLTLSQDESIQAENFRKIFLSMSEDIRVILIKLADRLHNMRTLESMPPEKQWKISSETTYFYVPIAHRLGLYSIKSELEDYAMQYTDPINYRLIYNKLKDTEKTRETMIHDFVVPIQQQLEEEGIVAQVSGRTKSICSIYQKMKRQNCQFEDVYDVFAVRFVFEAEPQDEVKRCWDIFRIVSKIYPHNKPDRIRDFLTNPKPNGYQALHTTVMGRSGKWIEVQIRSHRMDEIAERGFAAHYKYKEDGRTPKEYDNRVEDWLATIRTILKSDDSSALDFLNEVKLNLELKEVYVFTPKGDMRTLPAGSTVLDFAYDLHTNLGNKCLGGKVNSNIVPRNYVLKNGDQVEIITSKNQHPTTEWFDFVKTTRAKERIKEAIKLEQKKFSQEGMRILEGYFKELDYGFTPQNIGKIQGATKIRSPFEFWNYVADGKLSKERVAQILSEEKNKNLETFQKSITNALNEKSLDTLIDEELEKNPEIFMLDESSSEKIKHVIAPCCQPIPGDQVVGFQISSDEIVVHRTNCPEAIEQMSKFGNRIVKAKWRKDREIAFLAGIKLEGFDKKGMIKEIIDIISAQHNLNIRSLNIATKNGVFTGKLMLYIENVKALNELIEQLHGIDNLEKIQRVGFDLL
ncbi:MAG: bifunctional (p)ppGpp synthetase/guanosine-3',5'-bis(diphosphate) 3'-pyrophosphohydrolase [Bacteroidales bacterium]|jgi:GTP pyrophosphokinase|nr:bifunctional (p)ppGpp synthetase/guanosine-3',5'-bis(diphosphate) 3'-pyrophosphohydrolase [Bacteroidales bacterium]MCR5114525.1 RelA/SpoT family protein [Bacteroidales bacterium]